MCTLNIHGGERSTNAWWGTAPLQAPMLAVGGRLACATLTPGKVFKKIDVSKV